jgi:tagatose-1,6-bisphosphate aldolase non-catalytic subunit AgaZ/GatZ
MSVYGIRTLSPVLDSLEKLIFEKHQTNKQTLTSHKFVLIFILATLADNGVHLKSHIIVEKKH